MMKHGKILTLALSAVLALGLMAGCTPKDGGANTSSSGVSGAGGAASDTSSASSGMDAAVAGKLSDIHDAVKNVFGEAYIPSMAIDETMLEEQYGVKKEWVKEVVAEGPMISTHVDVFVGIEAVDEAAAAEVEKALTSYRDTIAGDTMQYPMNLAKVQAAQVQRIDNYVFFVLLGETTDEALDMSEEDQLAYYQAENQKAIDAIKGVLGK